MYNMTIEWWICDARVPRTVVAVVAVLVVSAQEGRGWEGHGSPHTGGQSDRPFPSPTYDDGHRAPHSARDQRYPEEVDEKIK